jgi:hypothetical protein
MRCCRYYLATMCRTPHTITRATLLVKKQRFKIVIPFLNVFRRMSRPILPSSCGNTVLCVCEEGGGGWCAPFYSHFPCNLIYAPMCLSVSQWHAAIHVWCMYSYDCSVLTYIRSCITANWPPLWSSGQSSWPQKQRSRVRFPALPDLLSSSGFGTGYTQPREDKWGAPWKK